MIMNRDSLKEYYGRILKNSSHLATNACSCSEESMPESVRNITRLLEPEILERFYGCGSPIPPLTAGCRILDLGCGTGRDVYILSKLAGESGFVTGIDMTDEQLAVAMRHVESQMHRFSFSRPNVAFIRGYIEDLSSCGIEDNSIDIVVSNCVINLSPDKPSVFREIYRVLKPGGELLFSDVFADRRIRAELQNDPLLHGECLSGALYREDFRRLMDEAGFRDFRITSRSPISIGNPEVADAIGMAGFTSETVRTFKISSLEDRCEDYGQTAAYHGTVNGHPHRFDLDDHHRFVTGKPLLVCGNTASMLQETRYSRHFTVTGDRSVHFGLFDCTSSSSLPDANAGTCCCL
jgi:ubiquinone/menaquinone biosynthesis C-methylase UbiE